jgi:putative peptidoglycan lipid II flippase
MTARGPDAENLRDDDATLILPAVSPVVAEAQPAPGPTVAGESGSVARNSAAMALGSIVSRFTGLLRTIAIGAAIGAGFVGDDYNLGFTLPAMVYELLLGGVLASVIIPQLVRARQRDSDGGEAYAQRLLSLAVVFLAVATVLAVAAAPVLTWILATNAEPPDRELITHFARLMLPAVFFYGLAALFAAILNTRGHYAAPMWTPILNNIVVIAVAGVFLLLPGSGRQLSPETITTVQVLTLGLGTTLGIVIQAAGLLPALRRVGFRWRWRRDFRLLNLGELGRTASWMLLYVVTNQVGVLIVLKIAKLVSGDESAGPIIFNNAFLIFMMAHGIVAVSIMTALMPRMSAAAAAGNHAALAAQLSHGTRLASVILVPAAAAYLVLGGPLAVTLFNWGNYTIDQAWRTGPVIAIAGLGLVPYAINQLQNSAFYAMRDTRTPALVNVPVVALRLAVDIGFWLVLPATIVTASLMGGTAISFVLGAGVGYWLLRRRLGDLGLAQVTRTLGRLVTAAVIAAAPAAAVVFWLNRTYGHDKLASVVQLTVGGVILVGLYVGAALALRIREVRDVAGMVRSRLGR